MVFRDMLIDDILFPTPVGMGASYLDEEPGH